MAQTNIALCQEGILRLLADSGGDAFRLLLQESLNAAMRDESAEQLYAGPHGRTSGRTGSRNGTRSRPLTTRVGTVG